MGRMMNLLIIAAILSGVSLPAWGIVLNQVDTFTALGTAGWAGGAAPSNINTGGPAGVGDRFLRIRRLALGNLATNNAAQWAGNYLAAGVGRIQMDMNLLVGSTPMIRIFLLGPGGTWATTIATPIAAGWNSYTFNLDNESMTLTAPGNQLPGTGVLSDTMAAVTKVLIRHDAAVTPTPPGGNPQDIIATLGIDNILALAPLPQLGDTDGDFDVDFDDFIAVQNFFGDTGPGSPGDADGDGDDDFDDFIAVQNFFGSAFPGASFVPEPLSAGLLALPALAMLRRSRKI